VLRTLLPAIAGLLPILVAPGVAAAVSAPPGTAPASKTAAEPSDADAEDDEEPEAEVREEPTGEPSDHRVGPTESAPEGPPETEADAKAPRDSTTSRAVEPKEPVGAKGAKEPKPRRRWGAKQADRLADPPDGRAWMIGLEGVILQAPPLRSRVVYIDPRFVGRSVAMGGGGLFARYRPIQFIGVDVGAHTGSVRYRGQDSETVVSQDQVLFDAGLLLYLGRGDVAQFALSGGVGGQYSRIGYELESGLEGTQTFGSALFRLGAEAEFLVKRVAFVLSFRTYGVLTDRDRVSNKGELLQGDTGPRTLAPVATLQTYLLGSAGIAFRF
jgi:hypothetical protein